MKVYYVLLFLGFIVACNTNKSVQDKLGAPVKFTLLNNSDTSIPLLIPTVMNPNLSPNSSSGVILKMGQEVLFRHKKKRYVLLIVDESIKPGDRIVVDELLQAKKKELGLE